MDAMTAEEIKTALVTGRDTPYALALRLVLADWVEDETTRALMPRLGDEDRQYHAGRAAALTAFAAEVADMERPSRPSAP